MRRMFALPFRSGTPAIQVAISSTLLDKAKIHTDEETLGQTIDIQESCNTDSLSSHHAPRTLSKSEHVPDSYSTLFLDALIISYKAVKYF
jgi:hypothetical protein